MFWFKKCNIKAKQAQQEKEVGLEVQAQKQKQKVAVDEAQKATDNLVRQVKDNGFTWKIYTAMGGR